MFVHHRTRGVTIKQVDRGEADQLFTIYTKDFGKIRVLGRAIRKICSKLRAGIEIFYLSEIEFIQGKYYKILTDALQIRKFRHLHRDLKKRTIAQRMTETLDSLIKGQEEEKEIWRLLNNVFVLLSIDELPDNNLELIYYYYFWNLVSVLGYRPELFHCSSCKKELRPESLHFSAQQGGVVCKKCSSEQEESREIAPDIIKIMRIMIAGDKKTLCNLKIEDEHLDSLRDISEDYFQFIMERSN